MAQSLTVAQIDELIRLNRLHRSLWWILLASNVVLFFLPDPSGASFSGPEAAEGLRVIAGSLMLTYRCALVWVFVSMAKLAKPWWGLGSSSVALAAILGFLFPLILVLSAGFRMWAMVMRLQLPGGFFGVRERRLLEMRRAALQAQDAAGAPTTVSPPVAPSPAPQTQGADPNPGSAGQEGTWLDRLDEHCRRIGTPTRWYHFHPEALAYGVLCGVPPEDFLMRGYSKRVKDLPEASRGFGKALADQLEWRIRTEFGLKRPS
ncbi:MAG: hypothetical protein LDL55_10915 [Armatimonadetes bacterium]|nr:hypothetical protein [Armatimonadota bacterium]